MPLEQRVVITARCEVCPDRVVVEAPTVRQAVMKLRYRLQWRVNLKTKTARCLLHTRTKPRNVQWLGQGVDVRDP